MWHEKADLRLIVNFIPMLVMKLSFGQFHNWHWMSAGRSAGRVNARLTSRAGRWAIGLVQPFQTISY